MNELETKIEVHCRNLEMVKNELSKVIVGQHTLVEKLLLALMTGGHVLIEGYPGLAKTLTIETLAKIMDMPFKRIQFTPDLLPSDLIGSLMYNPQTMDFVPEKGPIFTNFLMADEINRAPAKVQSALLECMQEKKVTIGKTTYKLDAPFLVMATQNPIEQEGTFELPEAQKDRFLFKINVNYPIREEEKEIIDRVALGKKYEIKTLINALDVLSWQELTKTIYVDEKIKKYVIEIVFATREPDKTLVKNMQQFIKLGASPRASIYIIMAAQAKALLSKRAFVIPEDVHSVAIDILQHRIILTYEAMAEAVSAASIIKEILKKVKIP